MVIAYATNTVLPMDSFPFLKKSNRRLQWQMERDLHDLGPVVYGIEKAIQELDAMTSVFAARTMNELDERERQRLLEWWVMFLDHQAALGRVVDTYKYFYQISFALNRILHAKAFFVGYAAFAVAYASGLQLVERVHENAFIDLILNDPCPRLGIPAHAYDRLSWQVLHVDGAFRLMVGFRHYGFMKPILRRSKTLVTHASVAEAVDYAFSWSVSRLQTHAKDWFPANGVRLLQKTTLRSILPLQKQIAEAMGHTRLSERKEFFIRPEQIDEMRKRLQPGDVLLERRNWYLSNVGIPGFWPHAALYLGDYRDFCTFFDVPEVWNYLAENGWKGVHEAIQATHPMILNVYRRNRDQVIEAKAEGVILTSLQESARADYVATLRPGLSRLKIFQACLEAMRHYGKPYDYGFDFITDSALVCSELVYKAYKSHLDLPLTAQLGRLMITATTFAEVCNQDRTIKKPRFTCVAFLDGNEKLGQAVFSTPEAFCQTWKRPKWDIIQP